MKLRSNKGFSLVELIIVIAILGIIAVIAVPNLTGIQQRSQVNADIRTAEAIGNAVRIALTEGNTNKTVEDLKNGWNVYTDVVDARYIGTEFIPESWQGDAADKIYNVKLDTTNTDGVTYVVVAIGTPSSNVEYKAGNAAGIAYVEGASDLAKGVASLATN